jgi:hypothetical protein
MLVFPYSHTTPFGAPLAWKLSPALQRGKLSVRCSCGCAAVVGALQLWVRILSYMLVGRRKDPVLDASGCMKPMGMAA